MSTGQTPAPKIVIVGGVAGGMSAAARLRRLSETARIVVFERSGYVSFANCGLPYYLGREIPERDDLLLQTPQSLAERFRLDVRVGHEVTAIDRAAKTVTVCNLGTGQTFTEPYDDLILSVGASPIRPALPGLDRPGVFTLRSMEDVDQIDDWVATRTPQRVVVAGGGYIGLEVAEQMRHRGLDVTLIDAGPQVLRPLDPEMAAWLHTELTDRGVRLLLNAPMQAIHPPEAQPAPASGAPAVGWVSVGEQAPLPADLVLVGLGVRPETSLAEQAGLALGERGGIRVDARLQTSDPNIWAVGDAIEVVHPVSQQMGIIALGGPANRQGRIVANNLMGRPDAYKGTWGTAIVRVFSLTAAATGLNEGQLRQLGWPYEAIHLHPNQHAGYYPGAQKIALKVLFNPETGALYGAQAVGKDGVDKRMDVLATAMAAGMTIRDLAELELSYAPPFGSAKDPINLAGMIGENILDGLLEQVQWHQLPNLDPNTSLLLDVRDNDERARWALPGSQHIPLGELRDRLESLPKDREIIAYCQSGQRSYFATRLLVQHGFRAKNLAGAVLTFRQAPLPERVLVGAAAG